jgi:hypothetical protein
MTADLFTHAPHRRPSAPSYNWRTVGHGNAQAALDIAQGATREEVRRRFKAGEYPDASARFIADNLAYWGR